MLKPQAIFYFCGQWKIKKRKKEKRSLNPPAALSANKSQLYKIRGNIEDHLYGLQTQTIGGGT